MNTENKKKGSSTEQSVPLEMDDKYTVGSCVLLSVTGDIYSIQTSDIDNSSDTQLFIKFLPENYSRSVESMAAFSQEVDRVKNGCEAFNVIAFEHTNESAYLVFGLPQGAFLSEKILQKDSYNNLADVLSFVSKIKDTLNTLKGCGLIHGCVGMDSIYLSDKDDVILLDSIYISAKQHQLEQDIERTETIPNREAIYASPDACFGRAISESDNVFSLACIVYQLLSGEHPFDGENSVAALLGKVRPQRIDSLTDVQWQHLENGMAFAKESRLETMDDFINGFDKVIGLNKKSSTKKNVDKVRETVLARKKAEKILGDQDKQQQVIRNSKKPRIKPRPTTSQFSHQKPFDDFQLELPKWAWIPLSLFIGVLTGAIVMGVAIEFLGIN